MLFTPFVKNVPSIDIQVFITIHHLSGFCQAMGGEECANVALLCRKVVVMMVKEKNKETRRKKGLL